MRDFIIPICLTHLRRMRLHATAIALFRKNAETHGISGTYCRRYRLLRAQSTAASTPAQMAATSSSAVT